MFSYKIVVTRIYWELTMEKSWLLAHHLILTILKQAGLKYYLTLYMIKNRHRKSTASPRLGQLIQNEAEVQNVVLTFTREGALFNSIGFLSNRRI